MDNKKGRKSRPSCVSMLRIVWVSSSGLEFAPPRLPRLNFHSPSAHRHVAMCRQLIKTKEGALEQAIPARSSLRPLFADLIEHVNHS